MQSVVYCSVDVSGSETSGTISYINCAFIDVDTITFNGTATYTYTNATSFSITYRNFSIRFNNEPAEVIENMTVTFASGEITISSDFTGTDNLVYRVQNFSVTAENPYTFTGRIYHSTHGYVELSGTMIAISTTECVTERPIAGTLTITGTGNNATITFNGCNSFSIVINGTETIANW